VGCHVLRKLCTTTGGWRQCRNPRPLHAMCLTALVRRAWQKNPSYVGAHSSQSPDWEPCPPARRQRLHQSGSLAAPPWPTENGGARIRGNSDQSGGSSDCRMKCKQHEQHLLSAAPKHCLDVSLRAPDARMRPTLLRGHTRRRPTQKGGEFTAGGSRKVRAITPADGSRAPMAIPLGRRATTQNSVALHKQPSIPTAGQLGAHPGP
jgi:hypothetical protein